MNNISPIQIATPILDDYFPIISALPQIPPLPNATLQIHCLILYSKFTFLQKVNSKSVTVWRIVPPLPQDTFCIKGVFLIHYAKSSLSCVCSDEHLDLPCLLIGSSSNMVIPTLHFSIFCHRTLRETLQALIIFFGNRWEIQSILKKVKWQIVRPEPTWHVFGT